MVMLSSFSWKHGINHFVYSQIDSSSLLSIMCPDLPKLSAYILEQGDLLGKSGRSILRSDVEFNLLSEVIDAMLPRKASKLQV